MRRKCAIILFISVFMLRQTYKIVYAKPETGYFYLNYLDESLKPSSTIFGISTKFTNGIASMSDLEISNNILETTSQRHKKFPDLFYVIYKYSRVTNLCIEKYMNDFRYISADSEYTFSYTHNAQTSVVYENNIKQEVSQTIGNEISVEGVDFVSLSESSFNEIASSVEQEIGMKYSKFYSNSVTETYKITPNTSTFYRLEKRGNFNVYLIQTFQAHYEIVNKKHFGLPGFLGYDHWDYELTKYLLKEQFVTYRYIYDSSAIGFYKYTYSGDKYIYDDIKEKQIFYN